VLHFQEKLAEVKQEYEDLFKKKELLYVAVNNIKKDHSGFWAWFLDDRRDWVVGEDLKAFVPEQGDLEVLLPNFSSASRREHHGRCH
jgi:hypothetical protein